MRHQEDNNENFLYLARRRPAVRGREGLLQQIYSDSVGDASISNSPPTRNKSNLTPLGTGFQSYHSWLIFAPIMHSPIRVRRPRGVLRGEAVSI